MADPTLRQGTTSIRPRRIGSRTAASAVVRRRSSRSASRGGQAEIGIVAGSTTGSTTCT
jgi:hypothetical protein